MMKTIKRVFNRVKEIFERMMSLPEDKRSFVEDISLIHHSIENMAQKIGNVENSLGRYNKELNECVDDKVLEEGFNTNDKIETSRRELTNLIDLCVDKIDKCVEINEIRYESTLKKLSSVAINQANNTFGYEDSNKTSIDKHNDNIIVLNDKFIDWLWANDIIDTKEDINQYNKERLIDSFSVMIDDNLFEGTLEREVI